MEYPAVGVHVFAGGFTRGVMARQPVRCQVERHGFGRETVEQRLNVPFVNEEDWQDWDQHRAVWSGARWCFGNPRCTGFSCTTAGCDDTIHGASAKCTQDIHELVQFGVQQQMDLIIWESVQQAYTVGRPLLDMIRDRYLGGYRIAHVFLNAASFGNAQRRKRYFHVAYRGGNFNVEPPKLPQRQTTVRDVIEQYAYLPTRQARLSGKRHDYDADSHRRLQPHDLDVIRKLRAEESTNTLGRYRPDDLPPRYREKWEDRTSNMPFSMFCLRRMAWDAPCPTLTSGGGNHVHPSLDRPITVREASLLMGWPAGMTPLGEKPYHQIAKGVCPEVGTWLAEQAALFLDGAWGGDDWSTRWDAPTGRWVGEEFTGQPREKVLNLSTFVPRLEEIPYGEALEIR